MHYRLEDQLQRLSNLKSSTKYGCNLCGFLTQVTQKHILDNTPNIIGFDYELFGHAPPVTYVELALHKMHTGTNTMTMICFHGLWRAGLELGVLLKHSESMSRARRVGVPNLVNDVDNNTICVDFGYGFSKRTLRFVRDKFELYVWNYQMRHGQCSQLRASKGPLRLLAVGDGNFVQLIETDHQFLQYLALRYCWSSSKSIASARTLASNLGFDVLLYFYCHGLSRMA